MPALLGGTGIIGKDIFVKMKAQKSASIQTASGTVVTFPQSEERAFSGLSIYGHSTQDGTPSPENPVPIVSAGDDGEINVTVQGGNLFNESGTPEVTKDGITVKWLQDEQCFLLNGTATGSGSSSIWNINIPAVKGADYAIGVKYISGNVQVPDGGYAVAYFGTSDELNQSTNWLSSHLLNSDSERAGECNANYITRFWFFITSGVVLNNYKCRVMLNAGSTALPYEPYKQPQTLTLSTPGGLPGIPVSSGGNYTDENGQQWLCDEIDLVRGKYVQRVKQVLILSEWLADGNRQSEFTETFNAYTAYNSPSDMMKQQAPICNVLEGEIYNLQDSPSCSVGGNYNIYLRFPRTICGNTLTEIKSWVDKNDVVVLYILETPIETDLPAEEIAAYKALHTYSPTTTVGNDAEAWMKVGYNEFSKQTF